MLKDKNFMRTMELYNVGVATDEAVERVQELLTGIYIYTLIESAVYVSLTLVIQECKIELEKRVSQLNTSV